MRIPPVVDDRSSVLDRGHRGALGAAHADLPRPHLVVERRLATERGDVVTLRVRPVHGEPPPFSPAQFSMIGLPGFGDVPISMSSPITDRAGHEFTIRRTGAITDALVDSDVGDVVTVRGPFGRPWALDRTDGRSVFVAGGIGLAPLRAAILAVLDRVPERPGDVSVLVGARSPGDVVFPGWLRELQTAGVDVEVTVDEVDAADDWRGRIGLVTELLDSRLDPGPGDQPVSLYVCGPDPMMTATARRSMSFGVPPERIQLTLERNMKCGVGWCGHCQLGPLLLCRDGPVVTADRLGNLLEVAEL